MCKQKYEKACVNVYVGLVCVLYVQNELLARKIRDPPNWSSLHLRNGHDDDDEDHTLRCDDDSLNV